LHEILEELARTLVHELALLVEELVRVADVSFRLLYRRHVQKYERLPQVVVCSKRANRARRCADHSARLSVPHAVAIRPRPDVQRVLQCGRDGAVVLGGDEEHGVSSFDPLTERSPRCRWVGVVILVVDRKLSDFDDLELEVGRRELPEGVCHLAIDRILAEAADENRHISCCVHAPPPKAV
jgi:hypothetical protein